MLFASSVSLVKPNNAAVPHAVCVTYFHNPFHDSESFSRSSWTGGNQLVYGVFSTPSNALAGSAVCAFSLADIARAFQGEFKGQKTANANWLPVKQSEGKGKESVKCYN